MDHFIAEVRSLKDPWESGRVQIRVYGRHDDEDNIKDDDLPWAMCLMPVTSASTNRVGTSPTGLLVGSRVIGYWLDEAHQYPVIMGSFHRAGKLKDEDDNTGGKDDIDEDYSDVPIAAIGSKNRTANTDTQSKFAGKRKYEPKKEKEPKYNKNDYVKHDDGEDALKKSREKHAKTADKATIGSVGKDDTGDVLKKILKVDQMNDAGALPQAPQMFQQIMQIGSMSSAGGINGLTGMGMGGALGGIAGSMGIGPVLGSLGNMLGIDVSQLSGITGMLGMMGGSGGGSGGGGGIGSGNYGSALIPYRKDSDGYAYPTTPNDVAVTAAELLNQLGGYATSTGEIEGLDLQDKEALYTAMITLMNSVGPDLNVKTNIKKSSSSTQKLILQSAPPQANIEVVISETPVRVTQITLPGRYVDSIDKIPDGYFPVYYFTEVDPYPGYMEWEGPEGERIFCPRPDDRPYVGTPTEDVINAAILAMLDDLLALIRAGKLTIAQAVQLLKKGRDSATDMGNQNTQGKGNNNNMMQQIMQLLGMLGGLLQNMESKQKPESVNDQGEIDKTLQDYKKKNADVRRKKKLAKQAVQQKNDSNSLMNNGLLSFGNIQGMMGQMGSNKGGSKGSPAVGTNAGTGSAQPYNTYITKTGNTVKIASSLNTNANANAISFGFYTIYKA